MINNKKIRSIKVTNPQLTGKNNPMADMNFATINEKTRLRILNEVGLTVTQLLDLDKILEYIQRVLREKLGIARSLIYLWDDDEHNYVLSSYYGIDLVAISEINERRKKDLDLVRQIAVTRKTILLANLVDDTRFSDQIRNKFKNHFYFGFPLLSRNTVIGVIELISPSLVKFDKEMIYFLETLGQEMGIAIDNATLVASSRKHQDDVLTLYQLGIKISSSLILSEVLDAVAESARTLLKSDLGIIGLYRESCQEIKIWSVNGVGGEALDGLTFFTDQDGLGKALLEGEVVTESDFRVDEAQSLYQVDFQDFNAYLAIPLHLGDKFLGAIGVLSKKRRHFSENDIQLLKQLGYHVFVSIENARLHQQLRYTATLEEQNRLARELHDNLAQAMGYIKIKAIMANDMVTRQDLEKSKEHLNELIKTTSVLYTDIREAIFNLRNTDSHQENFIYALQEYLDEYELHYGVDVRVSVDDNSSLEFPPEVANQLFRIIQEALSNVRKHACAQRVWIKCWQEQSNIFISIEDDGSGFDLQRISGDKKSKQSFGIQIMEERTHQIHGKFSIKSEPGSGTKIELKIPSVYIR